MIKQGILPTHITSLCACYIVLGLLLSQNSEALTIDPRMHSDDRHILGSSMLSDDTHAIWSFNWETEELETLARTSSRPFIHNGSRSDLLVWSEIHSGEKPIDIYTHLYKRNEQGEITEVEELSQNVLSLMSWIIPGTHMLITNWDGFIDGNFVSVR